MEVSEPSVVHKVAIIGAGISGISAARHLLKSGVDDIIILEATEKAGGRINTIEFGEGLIELGAQWIHGEQNEFCQLVKSSNHRHEKTSWEGKGPFLCPNGKQIENNVVDEVLGWLEDTIEKVEQTFTIETLQNEETFITGPTSMGKYLLQEFAHYMEEVHPEFCKDSNEYLQRLAIFQWGMSFQRIDNSCEKMNDLSLFRWSEFEVNPGEHYNNFKRGAQSFINEVLVSEEVGLKIKFNSIVRNIHWGNGNEPVKITLEQLGGNSVIFAESVLITVSVAVLKSNMESLFTPKLPSVLEQAINSTGFGPVTKIFLEWEEPWWPKDIKGYQLVWPEEFIDCCSGISKDTDKEAVLNENWPKAITGFDPVLCNPNVLLGWMGGPEAVYVEGLSDIEVGRKCKEILEAFIGLSIPHPKSVAVSKWNTNKFFQGAYSFRSVKGDRVSGDICSMLCDPVVVEDAHKNAKPVIVLAGEACSKTHYSTLHGAYESGQAQAAKLVQYFTTAESSSPHLTRNTVKEPCTKYNQASDIERHYSSKAHTCAVKN